MTEDTVAIVVRTKNRPDFLRRALASITAQSMSNWECVIVNDGGDQSAVDALVAELDEVHRARFHVVHHAESKGRWKSANAGVLATSAPLLVLHDDDDSWHPEFLERAVDYLRGHPERDGVVSRIEIVWEQREGSQLVETGREIFQPQLPAPTLSDTLLFNRFVPIAFVYRRSLHADLGLYDDSLPVVGDWAFNLRVLARGPLDYLGNTPYAYWHQRVGDAGPDGNSVIAAQDDHSAYDARIRDDALREYVADNGLGLALYLTRFIDRRFVEVEQGIRDEIKTRAHEPFTRRANRAIRRRLGLRD